MKAIRILLLPLLFMLLYGCTCNNTNEPVVKAPVTDSKVSIKIQRYEKALFSLSRNHFREGLENLQKDFSFFLDGDLNDSLNLNQLRAYLDDPMIRENYSETQKLFPSLDSLETQISQALTYYRHYYPDKKTPKVYTYVAGTDFDYPVKFADSVLIIALDMYLGAEYPVYTAAGLPAYFRKWMIPEVIARDCVEEMAYFYCYTEKNDPTFLDAMIYSGKVLWFIDALMPHTHDTIKIKYSSAQLDWCRKNEEHIWSYYISNKLLYSKDAKEFGKFLTAGPFTTPFGKESAPRTGEWTGWQIVRQYMQKNSNVSLKDLILENDSQKILKLSAYKPKKK